MSFAVKRSVFDFVCSMNVEDHPTDQLLSDVHEIIIVCIRHVKFDRGELRIMSQINALVSELTAYLVNTVQPSNNEHFQVELRCNSHVQIQIQVVVMGDEWSGRSPASNHVHHRRLHLKETSCVQIATNVSCDLRSEHKGPSNVLIHDKIKIPLTVSHLLIFEASPLLRRQHVQAGGQQLDFSGENRQFPTFGLARCSLDPDNISPLDSTVRHSKISFPFSMVGS
mmetsp:Transcript_49299/g.107571  ORF Transcript_49299/g.107571 Transcript_49299/m.107571 type:complete len:225 (-) Transcript_49299:549-1223(-)